MIPISSLYGYRVPIIPIESHCKEFFSCRVAERVPSRPADKGRPMNEAFTQLYRSRSSVGYRIKTLKFFQRSYSICSRTAVGVLRNAVFCGIPTARECRFQNSYNGVFFYLALATVALGRQRYSDEPRGFFTASGSFKLLWSRICITNSLA